MDKLKKRFVVPEAELINFLSDDVIATSSGLTGVALGGSWWDGDDDNDEDLGGE